jgi:hypothetical protein
LYSGSQLGMSEHPGSGRTASARGHGTTPPVTQLNTSMWLLPS